MKLMIMHTASEDRVVDFVYGPFPSLAATQSWMNEQGSDWNDFIVVDLDDLPEPDAPDWAHAHMFGL